MVEGGLGSGEDVHMCKGGSVVCMCVGCRKGLCRCRLFL